MMHAYPETYLNDAMNNLGNMFDYGLVDLHYDPERFYEQFLTSGVAKQFEQGNPKYVAGLSGPELAIEVIYRTDRRRCLPKKLINHRNTGQAGALPIISGIGHIVFPICSSMD